MDVGEPALGNSDWEGFDVDVPVRRLFTMYYLSLPTTELHQSLQQSYLILSMVQTCPEAEFLAENQTKVVRVFLLAIHSHLCSFTLRFLCIQTYATSYSIFILQCAIVNFKG